MKIIYKILIFIIINITILNANTDILPEIGGKFGELENLDIVSPPSDISENIALDEIKQLATPECDNHIWILGHLKVRYYWFEIKATAKTWAKYGSATSACGSYYNASKISANIKSGIDGNLIRKKGELKNSSYIKIKKKSGHGWGDYISSEHNLTKENGATMSAFIEVKNKSMSLILDPQTIIEF